MSAFTDTNHSLAVTPWAQMLRPQAPLPATAAKSGKWIPVEEWSYNPSPYSHGSKFDTIKSIGESFALRGIPMLYSSIIFGSETCSDCVTSDINILNNTKSPGQEQYGYKISSWGALERTISWTYEFAGDNGQRFNWSSFLPSGPGTGGGCFPIDIIGSIPRPCSDSNPNGCLGTLCSL